MSLRLGEGGGYRLLEAAGATQPVEPGTTSTAPNTLRVVGFDGTELLNLAINADTFILTKLDPGFPTVRAVGGAMPERDGEDDNTAHVGARAVTAEVFVAQTGTGPLIDRLTAVMHPGQRVWLYLGRADWPGERRIVGRGATFACPPGTMRIAQLGFHCADGLLEDAVEQSVTLNPVGGATGGFQFPVTFPLTFDSGAVPGSTSVATAGTAPTPVRWRLYGPFSDPIVRRVDTGHELSFPGLSVAAGDYLAVDTGTRTVLLNDDPAQSRYNRLSFATSRWWTLPASGATPVLFSATATGTGARAVLTFRDRYL